MWSEEININSIILVVIVAAIVIASPFVYERVVNYFHPQIQSAASSTTAINPDNAATTLADIKALALSVTKDGKLLLTWQHLSGDIYKVLIYRSPKNKADWQLWKTIVVTGYSGSAEITIPAGNDKSLFNYNYFFAAQNSGGSNLGVSDVAVFDVKHVTADGSIVTTSTEVAAPFSVVTGIVAATTSPATTTVPQTTNVSKTNSNSTTTATNTTNTTVPTSATTTVQQNYVYSPSGQIVGIINFPAPDQNFWVTYPDAGQNRLLVGWQNLPSATTRIVLSRSINSGGPWSNFFLQQNPVIVGPYNIYLVDIGVGTSFYYQLAAFDANGLRLATFGPVYLNAAVR